MIFDNIKIKPLECKHYDTQITLEVNGKNFLISIAGQGTKASKRAIFGGWEPDDGMNHVESEEHFYLASLILLKLLEEE